PKVSQLNRKAAAQVRKAAIDPSKGRCTLGTVRGHGASIEVIAPAAIGIEWEAIPGIIAVSAVVPALVVVVIAGPAAIHVFAGIGVELGHAAAEVFAAGIGVELGHAAAEIFAARIGVDASRFGHGFRSNQ